MLIYKNDVLQDIMETPSQQAKSNSTLLDKLKFYTKYRVMPFALAACFTLISPEMAEATTPGSTIIYNNMDAIVSGVDGVPLGRVDLSSQDPLKVNFGNNEYFKSTEDVVFKEYKFKFVLTDYTDRSKIILTNEIEHLNLEFTYGDSVGELRTNSVQDAGLPFSFRLDVPKDGFSIADTGDTQILNDGTTTKIYLMNFKFSNYLGNKQVLIPNGKVLRIKPTFSFSTVNSNADYLLFSTDPTDLSNGEITDGASIQSAGDTIFNPLEKISELDALPQIVSQYASKTVFECINIDPEMKFQSIALSSSNSSIHVVWNNLLYFNTPSFAIRGYSSVASFEAGDAPVVERITSLQDPVCGCSSPGSIEPEIVYPLGIDESDRENYFITIENSSFNFSMNDFSPSDTPFFTIEE